MNLKDAIAAYFEKFDEGPPIFGMDEVDAVDAIESALELGKPMEEGAEADIPSGAVL